MVAGQVAGGAANRLILTSHKLCPYAELSEYIWLWDMRGLDMPASFKNKLLQSDTVVGRDQASYWRVMLIALTALRGTTETKRING